MQFRPAVVTFVIVLLLASLPSVTSLHSGNIEKPQRVGEHSKSYPLSEESGHILIDASAEIYSNNWDNVTDSTHFSIHYNFTGPNATSYGYAKNISDALEHSWETEVTDFGFREPPDSKIDVYLTDLPDSPLDVFGRMTPAWHNMTGWHVGYITIDIDIPNVGLVNCTCAHEFFHTIQLSYRPLPDTFPSPVPENASEKDWITEGMAMWIESRVYPNYTGYASHLGDVDDYMYNPDRPITELEYDAVLYWIFIDEHHGGINTIKSILAQTTNEDGIAAVNNALIGRGTTFEDVFEEWTIANYLKNSSYVNGELYQSIYLTNYPFTYDGEEHPFSEFVFDWGVDYFQTSSSVIYMPVQFLGESTHSVTGIYIEYGTPITTALELNATYGGNFSIMQANNLDEVVIIIRSLGNETSRNITFYDLTFLNSSYSLEGPKQSVSPAATLSIIESNSMCLSSSLTLAVPGAMSAKNSSIFTVNSLNDTGICLSPSLALVVPSDTSLKNSSIFTINSLNDTSIQRSSTEQTVVANSSSSQNSSGLPFEVTMPPPDIAITSVIPSRTTVGTGYVLSINLTIENQGYTAETFNLTIQANATTIAEYMDIALPKRTSTIITFTWNTTDFVKGTYRISAAADRIPDETDIEDNTCVDGLILITIPSDTNGDRQVDIFDAILLANAFGSSSGDLNWDQNCDFNGDTVVDIFDAIILATHFGESW